MNDVTPKKGRLDPLDPAKEAQAVAALRAGIKALGEDEQLLIDTIEGQTGLFEIIDLVLERIRDKEVIVEGVASVMKALADRGTRAGKGIERDRALLEQALSIACLTTVVRPTATITLANRPPVLVVTEESEIPAKYWKDGEPVLDKKGLADALKARAAALKALPPEVDEADRQVVLAEHPDIPGATLSNGAPSLTIRSK